MPAPPASILYVSNNVAPDMDELTHNVSEWGGVSVPTTRRSQHSHGGSRMEWIWKTATESNLPNFLNCQVLFKLGDLGEFGIFNSVAVLHVHSILFPP